MPGYGMGGNNPLSVRAVLGRYVQLDVPLPAPATLEGSVTDDTGKPLASAVVSVYSLTVGPRPGRLLSIPAPFDRRFIVRTDQAGTFRIPGLPQGSRVYFRVSSPGRVPADGPTLDRMDSSTSPACPGVTGTSAST
jgi:hypothetical protein